MPRCMAAMGILGGESKMCYLVEDSLRHLRCRGMTSRGFPLEILILTYARWHDVLKKYPLKIQKKSLYLHNIHKYEQ